MKTKYVFVFAWLSFFAINAYAQRVDAQLIGKWQVKHQSELGFDQDDTVASIDEVYDRGDKIYEFTPDSQLIISENFGRDNKQSNPIRFKGGYFTIGKGKGKGKQLSDKIYYRLKDNTLILYKEDNDYRMLGFDREAQEMYLQRWMD